MTAIDPLLDQPWYPQAPPLPSPTGKVIRVASVDALYGAADRIAPGGTILIADGHYMMPTCFDIHTDGVTVRSESGARSKVILDGAQSEHIELFAFTNCHEVTAADLTIQNIRCNGFKINGNLHTSAVAIHNCVIHNIWQRGVKGVRGVPKDDGTEETHPVLDCRVQYCLFYNDRRKQFEDDTYEAEKPFNFGGNYIGGMDVMRCKGWTISDNVFVGIHGRTGCARGAIFIWNGSEDCLIERNIIIDCDSGICLGNGHRSVEPIHNTRVLVRNNFLTRCHSVGILSCYTEDCRIVNNTVCDPGNPLGNLIRVDRDAPGLYVANNLLAGMPIGVAMGMTTEKDTTQIENNIEGAPAKWFIDPAHGDLRLTNAATKAIGAAIPLDDVVEDIDGTPRAPSPTIGASEKNPR
jgi:copper-binding protein NosD